MQESQESKDKQGWAILLNSRKAHYFINGFSLCRKWGFYFGEVEDNQDEHSQNCVACKRAKSKMDKKV